MTWIEKARELGPEAFESWLERVAIMVVDGGLSEEHAQRAAYALVMEGKHVD